MCFLVFLLQICVAGLMQTFHVSTFRIFVWFALRHVVCNSLYRDEKRGNLIQRVFILFRHLHPN